MKRSILLTVAAVALIATMAQTASAEIRPAQVHRAEQLSNTDVCLKDAASVAKTPSVQAEKPTASSKVWVELQEHFMSRRVRHEITPSYGGGPTSGPSLR